MMYLHCMKARKSSPLTAVSVGLCLIGFGSVGCYNGLNGDAQVIKERQTLASEFVRAMEVIDVDYITQNACSSFHVATFESTMAKDRVGDFVKEYLRARIDRLEHVPQESDAGRLVFEADGFRVAVHTDQQNCVEVVE